MYKLKNYTKSEEKRKPCIANQQQFPIRGQTYCRCEYVIINKVPDKKDTKQVGQVNIRERAEENMMNREMRYRVT